MNDNTVNSRGMGIWNVALYKPETIVGPIKGTLNVGKDFHTISIEKDGITHYLLSAPSQNVAYVYDERVMKGKAEKQEEE